MDCCICVPEPELPIPSRPERRVMCGACYERVQKMIDLMNEPEREKVSVSTRNSSETRGYVSQWMSYAKDVENELKEEVSFLKAEVSFFRAGFFTALKDQIHTYIQLKPGINGSPIPAHRALLATGSPIFKHMLESDVCKATPEDTITLLEFNHEELECLLEFLYTGSLPKEKVEQHVVSLSRAADKYDIPYLQKFCERHMLRSLNSSNALDVLEISDIFSYSSLKKTALDFIVKHMEDITLSARYEEFARKNANLAVQITRLWVKGAKQI